ncbi:MAG: ubiquinol-cytochrome C chaperone family protein [Alphaproteobacteria bacterium]|nr:ubiquinol-cytochrome C chaperone family protein [Alphaproteobacteria bacterium]MBU0858415.1 ubiquinol-cytochrome C chaperone family protein [Alphaproteobacteria bacterium]
MNIFGWWRKRQNDKQAVRRIYDSLLAQARQPVFYRDLGVPDTTDGRFDMIVLHGFMVMRAGPGMNRFMRQNLFDVICRDLDRACREMGIGDLSVPRHMKRMMKAFKGRFFAYHSAVTDPQLMADALTRNLYRKTEALDKNVLNIVTVYVMDGLAQMAQMPEDDFRAGRIAFAPLEDHYGHRQQAAA